MAPRDRVGEDRIWFKATHGLEGVTEIGRDPGLCASAVPTDDATVIPDTLLDPVACSNPLVAGPMGVRFYAATPIITADGYRLGTVNVLDTRPREISEADSATLADLAAAVRDQLEPRLSALHVVRVEQERRKGRTSARRRKRQGGVRSGTGRPSPRSPPPCSAPWCPGTARGAGAGAGLPLQDRLPAEGGRRLLRRLPRRRRPVGFLPGRCVRQGHGSSLGHLTDPLHAAGRSRRRGLRAAALVDAEPTAALQALNTALLLDAAVGTRFCTAVFGLLDPAQDGGFTVTLATGGHPPAYHLTPSGGGGVRVEAVRAKGGMLVGAFAEAAFASRTWHPARAYCSTPTG